MSAVKILLTAEEFDSERPGALHRKLKHYFQAGVKEAWIIDPETNTAEIRTGASLPERELTVGDALTSALLPGFALPLAQFHSFRVPK